MKIWQKGLIVLVVGIAMNMILMNLGIRGLIMELARLAMLAGLVITIIGLISKK